MDLDLDPSWVMWKYVFLEVVWVPAEAVATSEFAKLVPSSELLLVSWVYSDPEIFILSLWQQWWQGQAF